VWKLAAAFAEVVLRRRGPESLPDSTFLLICLLVIDVAVLLLAAMTLDAGVSERDFVLIAVSMALFLAFTYAVLTFFKLERRYRQTVSAILGAEIWVTLVTIALALLALGFGLDVSGQPFNWLRLALSAWLAFVSASVLARSLSQPLIVGFMFEILYILTWLSISNVLVPPAATLSSASP